MIPFQQDSSHAKQLRDESIAALAAITDEQLHKICWFNPIKWTRQSVNYVRVQYLAQRSSYSIAEELNISQHAVLRVLRILGVPIRRSGSIPATSPEKQAEIAQLLKQFNQREVCEMLGTTRHAVQTVAAMERRNVQHQAH